MNNPCCTNCYETYTQSNPPRILNRCVHTFCSRCISQMTACPIDSTAIDFRRVGLAGFRINTGLLREAKKEPLVGRPSFKQSPVQPPPLTQRSPPPMSYPVQEETNRCLLHDKPLDLMCIDHLSRICSGCALFGDHKGHRIETIEKVMAECANLAQHTLNSLSEVVAKDQSLSDIVSQDKVSQQLREKRDFMVKSVRTKFKKLMDRLRKLQTMAVAAVDKLVEEQKERLFSETKLEEVMAKRANWVQQANKLIDLVESMSAEKLTDDAAKYLNDQCIEKTVCQRGDYLLVEMCSFQTTFKTKMQKFKEDLIVQFDERLQENLQKYAVVTRVSDKEVRKQNEKKEPQPSGEDYLLEEGLTITTKDEGLNPDTCQTLCNIDQMMLSEDNEVFSVGVTEIPAVEMSPRMPEVRQVQESYSSTSKDLTELRKKKKIKLPDKYEPIVEDLRMDRCQTIDLGGAQLGDAVILSICDYIKCSQRLRCLKLVRNKLTTDSLQAIVEACNEANVVSLNLGQNLMTDKAIEILQKIQLKKLNAITLSQNKLKERVCKPKVVEFKKRGITLSI